MQAGPNDAKIGEESHNRKAVLQCILAKGLHVAPLHVGAQVLPNRAGTRARGR